MSEVERAKMTEVEKAKIAQIKFERGRVKSSLTRLEGNFEHLKSKNEILIKLNRLDELFKEFERLDLMLSTEDSEIEEFESRYFNLKVEYTNKLDEITLAGRSAQSSTVVLPDSTSSFRLPKLNIPIFSGKFCDWINFKDLFIATVHSQTSLSGIQKFQYLKGLLFDEPASLITHIPIAESSYEKGWEKLMLGYNKKKQIIKSLIKTFLDQNSIPRTNNFNLRKLVDTSDEVFRGLKALGEDANYQL